MKKKIIISLVAFICFVGGAQAQWGSGFLIDQTYMTPYQPSVTSPYNTTFNNGCKFNGTRTTTGSRVDGYSGTFTLKDGSYYYGNFDGNLNPRGSGWFIKDNTPYYNTYGNNGKWISSTRVETNGQTWMITGFRRDQITFDINNYSSGNNYNNSNRSSNNNSYNRSNNHSRQCHACHGSGRLKKSVPDVSGYGISTKKYYCNECGETSMSRHIHINCTYCR